jgi:hypothetical protein
VGIGFKSSDEGGDGLGDTFGPGLAHGIEEDAVIVSGGTGGGERGPGCRTRQGRSDQSSVMLHPSNALWS